MFKKPGTYDVIMRYSSLLPKLMGDGAALPRGIGMKIFGIEGEKLWGEDKKTQDWTFNNYPVLELRTPRDTYEIADALERNWDNLAGFVDEGGKRKDADVATLPGRLPNQPSMSIPNGGSMTTGTDTMTASVRHARILSICLPPRQIRCQVRRFPTR